MNYLPRECFQPAIQRLDLLLHREILRLRAAYQLSLDEFRGLYVSDSQVDALVGQWGREQQGADVETLQAMITECEHTGRVALAADGYWNRLVDEFGLSLIEQDILLLAFAPQLALKYETLYAYLNNDITRKYPTTDLALRVLADDETYAACRSALSPRGILLRAQLLEKTGSESDGASLAAGFRVSPSVISYLLEGQPCDARLLPACEYLTHPPGTEYDSSSGNPDSALLEVLEGEPGAGRLAQVREQLAFRGMGVVHVEMTSLAAAGNMSGESLDVQLRRLLLQARLGRMGVYLNGIDRLFEGEVRERRETAAALLQLRQSSVPVYLAVACGAAWREWLTELPVRVQRFNDPDLPRRLQLWQAALAARRLSADAGDIQAVADRFVLNPGQIAAAATALGVAEDPHGKRLKSERLFAAARDQSVGSIGKLASKVSTTHCWDDLVLPRATLGRVNEAVAAIINRGLVYQQWQMSRRTGGNSGLMMMFSGSSGTGKTMCASLIAQAVGFDLYCIDLSSVVSKYIGDTEKNLDRIFTAARRANCIIFFDEADALLGKRSEVKDAHDRYANVEVAYLLQKMEQHDGVVIMATNIARNIDAAFSRRLHYTIEFPRPNAEHREQLWRGIFPPETPLDENVDFTFLARHFEGTGGDIKTIALDAAMQAAGNGQCINMQCLVRAMARQLIKQGKAPGAADFKQYFPLLESSLEPGAAGSRRVVRHPAAVSKHS